MTVLSDECILALQVATAAACIEALNAAPPAELWSHVLAVVNPVIRAQARMHMERLSCIARLPDELLLVIFERLPFWDRVRATTVCQNWRSLSLDAVSALWSDIPSLSNVDTYEPLLARARDTPVSLAYKPEYLDDLESFCYILLRNLSRVKSLRLILPEPEDDVQLFDAANHLDGIFRGDAPILESLVISDPGEIIGRVHSSIPLFKSPLLHTINLDGFDLSFLDSCIDSPVVKTLRVSTPDTYSRIIPADWSLLARLPALHALYLQLTDVFAADIGSAQRPKLPQSLQHLHLQAYPTVVDALVNVENLSRLQTVHITFLRRNGVLRQVADLLPSLADPAVSAAVHFSVAYFSLLAAESAGRRRVFRHVHIDEDWHTLLPNVARLWIDAYPGNNAALGISAVFPALEELTLDATPPAGDARPPAWPPLSCPRLRVVRVVSETARSPLDARSVLDYLRHAIGSGPRLERLVLDGVTLEADVDLTAVAENVSMVQSGEIPRESYRVWADLWATHLYS